MSPPISGANPRGPAYAGRFLKAKPAAAAGIHVRFSSATHHGGDEIAAQPRPRYFKMAPPHDPRAEARRAEAVPGRQRLVAPTRPPGSRTRSAAQSHAINPATTDGHPAIMADVAEVQVVVAHHERATLRVGDVFLKIDADQTRIDV